MERSILVVFDETLDDDDSVLFFMKRHGIQKVAPDIQYSTRRGATIL